MQLIKSEPNDVGELVSDLIEESNSLEQLKRRGLKIAREMANPDAMWIAGPIVGSNTIRDAKNWQLAISENFFLGISDN